jgi:hypothetical protein
MFDSAPYTKINEKKRRTKKKKKKKRKEKDLVGLFQCLICFVSNLEESLKVFISLFLCLWFFFFCNLEGQYPPKERKKMAAVLLRLLVG